MENLTIMYFDFRKEMDKNLFIGFRTFIKCFKMNYGKY